MIIIKDGTNFSKVYADKAFDEWGNPSQEDIRVVENNDTSNLPADTDIIDSDLPYDVNFDKYCDMIEHTLWIFNNEKIKIKKDEVYTVGSGVSWMFQQGKVFIYDISKTQVLFIESLIRNWNGKDYGRFVYDFILQNKVRHFHVNLNETQDQNIDLINDKNNFINEINENFARLLKKYSPNWSWDPSRYTVKNQNIIDVLSNVYLGKCLLSNVFNFKYYYAKCYVSNAHDLLSPSTTAFIKKVSVIKNKDENVCKKIDLDVPVEEIYKEIQNIKKYLYPHRSESGIGWKGFCIHGQKFNRTKEDAYYPDFLGHSWTVEAINHMPHTIAWLKTLGYNEFQRVRVMCLDPKGFINVHRDGVRGISNAVNIAINHPKHCEFYLQDYGLIEFSPGDAYSIDVSKYHTVVNNSNIPRYHIIIHGDK